MVRLVAAILLAGAFTSAVGGTECTLRVQAGESIQSAIDRAPSDAVICIAPGVYTGPLVVTKSLSLVGIGEDAGAVIIRIPPGWSPVWPETDGAIICVQHAKDISWSEGGTTHVQYEVSSLIDVRIENLTVLAPAARRLLGVLVRPGARVVIQECHFRDLGVGVVTYTQSEPVRVVDCAFAGNERGLQLYGDRTLLGDRPEHNVVRCTVEDSLGHGIWVGGFCTVTLEYSVVSGNGLDGVHQSWEASLQIYDTVIERNEGYGIGSSDYRNGLIRGARNIIPDRDEEAGNLLGGVTPELNLLLPEGFFLTLTEIGP